MTWQVPSWSAALSGQVDSVKAARPFAAGECVETVYCLEVQPNSPPGAFANVLFEAYCPLVSFGPRRVRLWPCGWALLYAQSATSANLSVHHRYEPPPLRPATESGGEESNDDGEDFVPSPCHWLVFIATRPIQRGEDLVSPPLAGAAAVNSGGCLPHIFRAAVASTTACPREDCHNELTVDTPGAICLEDGASAAVLAASLVHGVGVFASRDIQEGEILEVAPTLPVRDDATRCTGLEHYIFEGPFREADGVSLMHLGFGGIYNHSDDANVCHQPFDDSHPFLEEWVADKFVPAGTELCHDYGEPYFESRGIVIKKVAGHGSCLKGCLDFFAILVCRVCGLRE